MEKEGGGAYDPAVDVAVGPDGEAMSVAKLLVNLLQGPYNGLYDALLQNLYMYMHKGVDDLHTDTLLMALRLAPHLEEIGASDGWGCFWVFVDGAFANGRGNRPPRVWARFA